MLSSYNTQFVGKVYYHLEKVASTNDFAINLTKTESVIEGTVVRTSHQFAGKGQMGNTWFDTPNENLILSVVLKPTFLAPSNMYLLNMSVALAVRDTLHSYAKNAVIKWPNDIYLKNSKVGGILIENSLLGSKLQHSVIGLGINGNQQKFPKELPNATSLFLSRNETIDLDELYQRLIWNLETRYMALKNEEWEEIKSQYLYNLKFYNEPRTFKTVKGIIKGRITDVTNSGKLVIASSDESHEFDIKQVFF